LLLFRAVWPANAFGLRMCGSSAPFLAQPSVPQGLAISDQVSGFAAGAPSCDHLQCCVVSLMLKANASGAVRGAAVCGFMGYLIILVAGTGFEPVTFRL
jgi:hypothetical protein